MSAVESLGTRVALSMRGLEQLLEQAGVPASFDSSQVEVPGVWLASQSVDVTTLDGSGTHLVWAYVIAPDNGAQDAHEHLGKLLDLMAQVGVEPDGPVTTNESIVLPDNPTPLPAYRVPIELEV